MELRDLIVTPIIICLVCTIAYLIKPQVTDHITKRYFFPALLLKMVGAILLGVLYQFYYQGGDTTNFHTHGSRIIWEALFDSPITGLKLLFSQGGMIGQTFEYSSKIIFYTDSSSFFVVRLATIFDLLTFSSYSATAVLFSVLSFSGMWALYLTFYNKAQHLHLPLAIASLFIPSVVFWGSGIMKDTVTLAALGFLTHSINSIFILKRHSIFTFLIIIISAWVIFSIKIYILLCFLPAAFFWIHGNRLMRIKSTILKIVIAPVTILMLVLTSYYAVVLVGENDPRYSIDKIAETAQITAYDIGFYTGRDAGSGYDLGKLDGTIIGMISLFPEAINVSLFRPYLWEIRNPLMLLSALESFTLLCITLFLFFRFRIRTIRSIFDPSILFCLMFSLTFAFAVGVSTFNFGTLARYKIPLLPFYAIAVILILDYVNRDKKFEVLEVTE